MSQEEIKYGSLLELTLCFASTQDEAHPAEALRVQATNSSGWQSAKYCTYPQELGFRFAGEVYLQHVRLLSHESKIASCVDVQVAEASPSEVQSGICEPYEKAQFKRLGYVRFTKNTENECRARELKTIGVMHQCVYLKLVFRRPHHNAYNLFEQVGVVALRAYGKLLRPFNEWKSTLLTIRVGEEMPIDLEKMTPFGSNDQPSSNNNNSRSSAMQNKLAPSNSNNNNKNNINKLGKGEESHTPFSMQHGSKNHIRNNNNNNNAYEAVLRRIREMKELKLQAVAEEDYDLADSLKRQIAMLEPALDTIRQLEEQKKRAIDEEDYQRAKLFKQQIDALQRGDYNGMSLSHVSHSYNSIPPVSSVTHTLPQVNEPSAAAIGTAKQEPGMMANNTPAHIAPTITSINNNLGNKGSTTNNNNNNNNVVIGKGAKSPSHKTGVLDNVAVASQGFYDVDKALMREQEQQNNNSDNVLALPVAATSTSRSALPNNSATIPVEGNGTAWEMTFNNLILSFAQDILAGTSSALSSSTSSLSLLPQPLTSEIRNESMECERVFGVYAAACLFGKRGQLREAAIRAAASPDGMNVIIPQCASALEVLLTYFASKGHGFKDPVAGVVLCVGEALERIANGDLKNYTEGANSNNNKSSSVTSLLSKLLPDVCARVGDANSRVREAIEKLLISLAQSSEFTPERIVNELLRGVNEIAKPTSSSANNGNKPNSSSSSAVAARGTTSVGGGGGPNSKANTNAHACLSRINILSSLVAEYSVDHTKNNKAVDASIILNRAVRPNLQHATVTVREAATRLLAQLVLLNPSLCQRVLQELKPAQRTLVDKHLENLRSKNSNNIVQGVRPTISAGKNMETHSMSLIKKNASPARSDSGVIKPNVTPVRTGSASSNMSSNNGGKVDTTPREAANREINNQEVKNKSLQQEKQQQPQRRPLVSAASSSITTANTTNRSMNNSTTTASSEYSDASSTDYEDTANNNNNKKISNNNNISAVKQTNNTNNNAGQAANNPSSGPSTKPQPNANNENTKSKTEKENRALHTCQFCGEFNKKFNEISLDLHYVRACPMLCPCPLCDQVTEICTLQQHLVNECEGKYLVKQCPRCHEAVQAEDLKAHIAARQCILAVPTHSVCPLCHKRFRTGVDGWRRHLAMAPGCPNNPRKYDGSGPLES